MILEVRPLFSDFSQLGQGEDLKSSAVSENRKAQSHEFVQPTLPGDHFLSRPDMEMVGISEDNLSSKFVKLRRRHSLDGALRANGHEHGRLNKTATRPQGSRSRFGGRVRGQECVRGGQTSRAQTVFPVTIVRTTRPLSSVP